MHYNNIIVYVFCVCVLGGVVVGRDLGVSKGIFTSDGNNRD